jgi:hypothetical protein
VSGPPNSSGTEQPSWMLFGHPNSAWKNGSLAAMLR